MVLSRSGWALATVAALSAALLAPGTEAQVAAIDGADFPRTLLAIGSLLQLTISGWVLAVSGLAHVRSTSRLARVITPRAVRRLLFVGAAGALALSPAQADRGSSHTVAREHSLDGLRLPDRPLSSGAPTDTVTVRPGDTLWAIAARSLHHAASDAEIAHACRRWHAANLSVIGPDPNLILPRQQLTPPTKGTP